MCDWDAENLWGAGDHGGCLQPILSLIVHWTVRSHANNLILWIFMATKHEDARWGVTKLVTIAMQSEECHQLSLLSKWRVPPTFSSLHYKSPYLMFSTSPTTSPFLYYLVSFNMAKPFFTLSLSSLCIVLLASSCIAISSERFNECQLESLNALEPDHRVECDGGLIETWNSQHPELKCAGVTVSRRTLHRNALHSPSYSPYPQLILIVQGN